MSLNSESDGFPDFFRISYAASEGRSSNRYPWTRFCNAIVWCGLINRGIFFIGSDGVVQTVARDGMPLEGSTILNASYLGDSFEFMEFDPLNNDRRVAGINAVNDAGQVPFWAILTDGRSGIFLWKSTAEPPDEDTIYADGFE